MPPHSTRNAIHAPVRLVRHSNLQPSVSSRYLSVVETRVVRLTAGRLSHVFEAEAEAEAEPEPANIADCSPSPFSRDLHASLDSTAHEPTSWLPGRRI